jgi:hypothetical protein
MRQLFSKADLWDLGLLLIIVLLLASVPSTAGLVVVSGPSQPELTMNICQPPQTFNLALNTLVAPPAPTVPEFVLCDMGLAAPTGTVRPVDYRKAPDTPPPKLV